jgi:hypothetical protein
LKLKDPITNSNIDQLDAAGRSKRGASGTLSAAGNVSLPLRVLGDFLDEKGAVTFSISWSTHSVTVQYETANGDHKAGRFHD